MDKDMVDKNMLYSFVPPSLGCFFAASADLCDPPSFPSPLFSFYFVVSFHFCCCSFLALLFTPHVRPFLSSSFAGLFCSKYVAFWLHHFVSFALAVLGQLDVLLPLMFSPTTRPWLYKWIWVWHVPTQWRLVL